MRRTLDSSVGRAVAVLVLVGGGAVVLARHPTVSAGGATARTGVVLSVVAGVALLPAVVSHARDGERRRALRWGLFAVGVPLSLAGGSLAALGVLAVLGSLVVDRGVDRRASGEEST